MNKGDKALYKLTEAAVKCVKARTDIDIVFFSNGDIQIVIPFGDMAHPNFHPDFLPMAIDEDEWYGFGCMDCLADTAYIGHYYMVNDELWETAVPNSDGMLCLDCLERRIGRSLNSDDFPDFPVNHHNEILAKRYGFASEVWG